MSISFSKTSGTSKKDESPDPHSLPVMTSNTMAVAIVCMYINNSQPYIYIPAAQVSLQSLWAIRPYHLHMSHRYLINSLIQNPALPLLLQTSYVLRLSHQQKTLSPTQLLKPETWVSFFPFQYQIHFKSFHLSPSLLPLE